MKMYILYRLQISFCEQICKVVKLWPSYHQIS